MEIDRPQSKPRQSGSDFWRERAAAVDVREPHRETIEHIAGEKRPTNAVWWVLWAIIAYCWIVFLWFIPIDWKSLALGAASMFVFLGFAVEKAGPSWFRQTPRR